MAETNVTMMFFLPPAKVHQMLETQMRRLNTYEVCDALSDLCDEYWEVYTDVHTVPDKEDFEAREKKIQSFFQMQATVKVLKDWGWWSNEYNIPVNWQKEDLDEDTQRTKSSD